MIDEKDLDADEVVFGQTRSGLTSALTLGALDAHRGRGILIIDPKSDDEAAMRVSQNAHREREDSSQDDE